MNYKPLEASPKTPRRVTCRALHGFFLLCKAL